MSPPCPTSTASTRWQLLHGSYLQDWLLDPLATSWRVSTQTGGPSLTFADIGSHWCDLMERVTGERIASVMAAITITVAQRPSGSVATLGGTACEGEMADVDTEDAATVLFRTCSGVLGTMAVFQVSAGRRNRLWFRRGRPASRRRSWPAAGRCAVC